MSYENSAACLLVASRCACCGRPLVDAVSVETGIGPVCRDRHGYDIAETDPDFAAASETLSQLAEDAPSSVLEAIAAKCSHDAANRLTHAAAVAEGTPRAAILARAIADLGFLRLATRIAVNAGARHVRVTRCDSDAFGASLSVDAPYSGEFVEAVRDARLPNRFVKVGRKATRFFPIARGREVLQAIRASFPAGTVVQTDRAMVTL